MHFHRHTNMLDVLSLSLAVVQAKQAQKHTSPGPDATAKPAPAMGSPGLDGGKSLPSMPLTPSPAARAGITPAREAPGSDSTSAATKELAASRNGRISSSMQSAATPAAASDEIAECVICWDAAANVVLQPCGHVCACSGCAVVLEEALCPMCRCEVVSNIVLQL